MDLVVAGVAGIGIGIGLILGVAVARVLGRYLFPRDDDRGR